MGRPKLHLPLGSSTVLASTVDAALRAGLRVIIVRRPDDPGVETYAVPDRVLVAINPEPERGMLSSLRAALALAEESRSAAGDFFFIPGDMPLVRTSTYELLLEVEHEGPLIAAFRGRRGHPVFMPAGFRGAILGLPDDGKLRDLIDAAGPRLVETGDEGTVTDIDLPEEYERALALATKILSPSCIPRAGG
jgi:molybdenum cofactor cytidylyltransferase